MCPVLLRYLPHMTEISTSPSLDLNLQKVLVPTDFSKLSGKAVRYGLALASKFGAELHLVHVVDFGDINHAALRLGPLDVDRLELEASQSAETELSKLAEGQSVRIQTRVLSGPAVSTISKYAKEQEIDLMVISTHGHTGLAHIMLGSTAESLVRHAPCPVLTVRLEEHDFVQS